MKGSTIYYSFIFAAVAVALLFGHWETAVLIAPGAVVDPETLTKELEDAVTKAKSFRDEAKAAMEEITGRKGQLPVAVKEEIDKIIAKYNETSEQIADLGQKMAAATKTRDEEREKTWGEQFIEGDKYKSAVNDGVASGRDSRYVASVKQVTSATAAGLVRRPSREPEVIGLQRESFAVRDLIPTIRTDTAAIEYARQTTRTNNAAVVAEAAAKPYSDYAWDVATVNVKVLAHLAKLTRQAIDDAPRLVGEIDSEMRYGLRYVEDRQYLFGSGVGNNLHGIMPQATAFARPAGFGQYANATHIDVLRVAMLANVIALLPATGIVLNDIDWAKIELTKDGNNLYVIGNPQSLSGPRLWSLPVVTTPAMTVDNYLVGNFALGARIYDRMSVEVLISTENADDFEKNLATMRAEERTAIAVVRPQAFTKDTFTASKTALAA